MLVVPIFVPLMQGYGLSMSEVLQTQAVFALTVALLEVPSGYIADMWGRKRAIVLGSLLNGFAFLSLLYADSFADFIVYEVIIGIGVSLISGADLALLYDSETWLMNNDNTSNTEARRSLSRLIAIEAGASGFAGILASMILLFSDMEALLWVQALVGFVPLVMSFWLTETPRPGLEVNHAGNARQIFDLLLFDKPVVLWTTFAIIAFGLLGLYSFWLYQKCWELAGIEVAYNGYIWAAFAMTVSLAARYAPALEVRLGWRRTLVLASVLPFIGLLGMALATGWIGVAFGFAIQVTRGLSLTLFYDALNRRVPGEFRATMNSLVSLGVRAAFIVTGPILGYVLDSQGMSFTLVMLALIFAPLFLLVVHNLGRRIVREGKSEAEAQTAVHDPGEPVSVN